MSSSTRQGLPSITAGLAAELIDRFSRQVLVKEIGIRGLKRLLGSRVVIVGCGATGSLAAELLARAGVGFIRIVDRDFVELSNLQRTHLFTEEDARNAVPKAVACAERLRSVSSFVRVEPVVASIRPGNAEELVMDADVIFDGTDNYATRYVVNDVAVKLGKPWMFVGVERWYGNVMFVSPGKTPCLRCLVPEPPEERGDACDVLGVVNTAVSMTVSVAVSELIKYLLELEPSRELMIVDSFYNEVHKVEVRRNERCPACGMKRFDFLVAEEGGRARRVCGTQAVEVYPPTTLG